MEDNAAVGEDPQLKQSTPSENSQREISIIERRYAKTCARFQNGVRVGFGFRFEHTCRPWNCKEHCGSTPVLFHRQCRLFESIPHQQVVLRSPDSSERLEKKLGRVSTALVGCDPGWLTAC